MLRIYGLVLFLDLVWTHGPVPDHGTDSVFLPRSEAQQVLVRQRRANSFLEELRPGNMERECVEERCDYEEAREIFQNSELTNDFWAKYLDGDACESSPCKNGGHCRDSIGGFACVCQAGFKGDNCDTVILVLCEDQNGGCEHFCEVERGAVRCSCADGYFLSHDQRSCESTEPFKCGVIITDQTRPFQTRTVFYDHNQNLNLTQDQDQTETHPDPSGPNRTRVYSPDKSLVHSPDHSLDSAENSSVIPPQAYREQSHLDPGLEPGLESGLDPGVDLDYSVGLGVESSDLEKIRSEMKTRPEIMNGYNCPPGDCPWQALLLNEQHRGFCGGTVLNELIVLTAAHCMNQSRDIFVLLGEWDRRVKHGNEAVHRVEAVLVHKFYRPETHHHDIALIKLRRAIRFSRDILPACLPTQDFAQRVLMSEAVGVVTGFLRSPLLQRLAVPYVDRLRCLESTPFRISTRMFCAGYEEGGEGECPGDWGGPHLTRYRGTYFITGIATWTQGCARRGQYGLYTQVSKYLLWIREGIRVLVSNSHVQNQNQNQDQDQDQNKKRKRRSAPETQQVLGLEEDPVRTRPEPNQDQRGFGVFHL